MVDKNISKTLNHVLSAIKKLSKGANELSLVILAYNVLKYAKKISNGLMTESEAMNLLTKSANGILVTDCIWLVSSILLWAIEQYDKAAKKKAEKATEEETKDEFVNLDDEKTFADMMSDEPATT